MIHIYNPRTQEMETKEPEVQDCQGAGEMVQQLRALAVLPEDLGSIPNTHTANHNCL